MQRRSFHEDFPATACILLVILAFFALELVETYRTGGGLPGIGLGGIPGDVLYSLGSLHVHSAIDRQQYWRILAVGFVHGGYLHVLMNAWVLYDLGRVTEARLSSWKFALVYVVCLIGGSTGTMIHQYITPRGGSVGASGALCGLIGLWLVYAIRQRQQELRDYLFRWVGFIVILSLFVRGVDHAGHLGGFVMGTALGFLTRSDHISSRDAARWRYLGYVAALALVALISMALWSFFGSR